MVTFYYPLCNRFVYPDNLNDTKGFISVQATKAWFYVAKKQFDVKKR